MSSNYNLEKDGFSELAENYDRDFTCSSVGRIQREQVWRHLNKFLKDKKDLKILELNCGTGEDARRFLELGHQVHVTDYSSPMLEKAKDKCADFSTALFYQLDLNEISAFKQRDQFDLVFSNFAGLNCIDSKAMKALAGKIHELLLPNGRFIAVFLSTDCFWEQLYFKRKGKPNEAYRRKTSDSVAVRLGKKEIDTWFYTPEELKEIFHALNCLATNGIGLFVPPSYLNPFFRNKGQILSLLSALDRSLASLGRLANKADHFLLHFEKGV